MAKLTTQTAYEVARWAISIEDLDCGQMVLRSDGVILRKAAAAGSRWTRSGKAGPSFVVEPDVLARVYARKGYTLNRIGG